MKCSSLIFLFGTIIYCFTGCQKSKNEKTFSTSLVGSWELHGAMGQVPFQTYPAGNGNILKFTNSAYQILLNGVVQKSGTYAVVQDTTVLANVCLVLPEGTYQNRIIYDNDDSSHKVFFHISNDTLKLVSGCFIYDGGTLYEYTRVEGSGITEY